MFFIIISKRGEKTVTFKYRDDFSGETLRLVDNLSHPVIDTYLIM